MDKQRLRDQGSFTLKRVAVLITVTVAMGGGFFAAVYFFNQWYLRTNSVPLEKILVSLDTKDENSSAQEKQSSQSDITSDLTFFKNLTDKNNPYPTAPPAPSAPQKSAAPTPPPAKISDSPPPPPPAKTLKENSMSQTDTERFTVQVGSFQYRSGAEFLQKDLETKGFSPYIVSVRLDNGLVWYRIRVGKALSRSDADALAWKLQTRAKVKPIVVSDK